MPMASESEIPTFTGDEMAWVQSQNWDKVVNSETGSPIHSTQGPKEIEVMQKLEKQTLNPEDNKMETRKEEEEPDFGEDEKDESMKPKENCFVPGGTTSDGEVASTNAYPPHCQGSQQIHPTTGQEVSQQSILQISP